MILKKSQFIPVFINEDIFKDKKFSIVLMCWCHLYSEYDSEEGKWRVDWPQLKKDIIKENGCEEQYGMSRYKFNQATKLLREKGIVSEDGKYIRGYQKGDLYVNVSTYTLDWLCRNLDDFGLRIYLYLRNKWNLRERTNKWMRFYKFSMKELMLAAGYKYNYKTLPHVKNALKTLRGEGLIDISGPRRASKESGSYMELYGVKELDDFAPLEDIIWFRHEFYGMEWSKENLRFVVGKVRKECEGTRQKDWIAGKYDNDVSFVVADTMKGLPEKRFEKLAAEQGNNDLGREYDNFPF